MEDTEHGNGMHRMLVLGLNHTVNERHLAREWNVQVEWENGRESECWD